LGKTFRGLVFAFLFSVLAFTSAFSQSDNNIIDSFGNHELPGWYWGGSLNMQYSHKEDNLENGYAIISATGLIQPTTYVGLVRKEAKFQVAQNNILSVMLQGTGTDLYVTVSILFDLNNDGKYDENFDARIESKKIPLGFSGWKEIHMNINENEFKVVTKISGEDLSVLENEAMGLQISYQTGKDFVPGKIETGIALIAERPNKEIKQENAENNTTDPDESFFKTKNYPNPFNPNTTINYTLKSATHVNITVYDRLGREVVVLADENQSEGEYSIEFNGSNLPSGIYFYRIKTPEKTEVRKMVLAK
jgi:Secretion system C-terminal sorting domain